jgi:transposase
VLAQFAEEAGGEDGRYPRVSDDELIGVICGWDRVEAHASGQKHAAVAELLRRRPAPGAGVDKGSGLPVEWGEFVGREIGAALAVSAVAAEEAVALAAALEISLPGTRAAYHCGILAHDKAGVIAAATMLLVPAEARAAEAMVLGRAGGMTAAGLRAAISRAVMQVNPEKARKRREHAARSARVARWAEPSGNAGLTGRELPPAQVLAADQRITWWATETPHRFRTGDPIGFSPERTGKVPRGKYYTPEFKEQAARKVVEGSLKVAQVARELDVNETTLGCWVAAYRKKIAGNPLPADMPESERVRELERRVRDLEMENAFLKKAAAYFAREQR